jgi:hypothetical protein
MLTSKLITRKVYLPKPDYPYLGEYNGLIVLFQKPNQGFVVSSLQNKAGYWKSCWKEDDFKPLVGIVCLSNKNLFTKEDVRVATSLV